MSLHTDIISWRAECAVRGQYGGQVRLANADRQYGLALVGTVLQVSLESEAFSDLIETACFEGTVDWLHGVVRSLEDAVGLSQDAAEVRVQSFFARLASRPINTYRYDGDTNDPLGELLTVFGGVPAALVSLTLATPNPFVGVVSGNNLLEELRKVAQSGEADVFVQRDGTLTAEHWKDSSDAVDVTIPDQAVLSAETTGERGVGPSRLKVRGRFISKANCGPRMMSPVRWPSRDGKVEVWPVHCVKAGVAEPDADDDVLVAGREGDARNSTISLADASLQEVVEATDGLLVLRVSAAAGAYLGQGDSEHTVQVSGNVRPENEAEAAAAQEGQQKDNQAKPEKAIRAMAAMLGHGAFPGGAAGGGGVIGGGAGNVQPADAAEPVQIEMTVDDPDLQAEFGVITEQIDNEYISDMETLFDVAVRRFQEFKMARREWQVRVIYLPCLQLNQVVRFTTPDGDETVTGLLRAIFVDYVPAPKASMRLVVESFEEIGSTAYCSGNLFLYAELCGVEIGGTWVPSDADEVWANDGYISLDATAGDEYVEQSLRGEVGAEYTVTWDTDAPNGGSIQASVEAGGAGESGASPLSFTCTNRDITIRFTANGGKVHLSHPSLVKCVTK